MVKEFRRLVNGLAAKYFSDGLDIEDLKQEAWIAILENHPLYSTDMGVSLHTFLGRKIRNRLEKFQADSLDLVELSRTREWVAESIADGPSEAIRAPSKAKCNELREALGPENYRKPYRHMEMARITVSFDEGGPDSNSDGESELSLHERVGTGPEQELLMLASETENRIAKKGSEFTEILRLRKQGYTFDQIGVLVSKDPDAIRMAFSRAQKRLNKKKAA